VLALCVLAGTGLSAAQVGAPRTQAAEVARALASATPGDTVLFCPDQLGPAVSRLAPAGLDLVGYPDLAPADRVDWTDYAERNRAADPAVVAARVSARAGGQAVYVVSSRGYRVPSDTDCLWLRQALTALRGDPEQVVQRDPGEGEGMRMHRFPPVRDPGGP
jgi:mannosyltransferase